MPPPPTFGTTALTITHLLQRNKAGARLGHLALKLDDEHAAILADWCAFYQLDRYHMPDATNVLYLLRKMNYVQRLNEEGEVYEVAFRVVKILVDRFKGKKPKGKKPTGQAVRAADDQTVELLARKVAILWKRHNEKGEGEEEEEEEEEEVGLGIKQGNDDEDSEEDGEGDGVEHGEADDEEADDQNGDDEDIAENDVSSRIRLENVYASPAAIQPSVVTPRKPLTAAAPKASTEPKAAPIPKKHHGSSSSSRIRLENVYASPAAIQPSVVTPRKPSTAAAPKASTEPKAAPIPKKHYAARTRSFFGTTPPPPPPTVQPPTVHHLEPVAKNELQHDKGKMMAWTARWNLLEGRREVLDKEIEALEDEAGELKRVVRNMQRELVLLS
ncbi:unnamed protein product [Zymoseptoria tritici ST99CH_1E4]|uniref:Uncharacterized protein n=1 Tax=Zymoseptoria tritici ST99CH_1E4 TaxID=1276532 RepID=A0A2H1HBW8_ZYMTR|nr:unnamed protein product [Zymoseptoria tritici ST99CH_1E4]